MYYDYLIIIEQYSLIFSHMNYNLLCLLFNIFYILINNISYNNVKSKLIKV